MNTRIRKLFSLSADEIFSRFKEKLFVRQEQLMDSLGIKPVCRKFKQKTTPSRFFTSCYRKDLRKKKIVEHLKSESIIQAADDILQGNLFLLGHQMNIPQGKDWHTDPVDQCEWPNSFYAKVRHHPSVENCDIKYIWEINRHQYLIPLAKAFWLTDNQAYAQKIFEIMTDWIDANTYNRGVCWISALEHAVRLFSWIWSLELCNSSPAYTRYIDKIKASIYQQAYSVAGHLSVYSSPYNHLVGEAAALHLVGLMFPEFDKAEMWEKTGYEILEKTVEKQFHRDGVTVEQAFFYHHFTLGFYLQTIYLRMLNGKAVSPRLKYRIEAAVESSVLMTMPNQRTPMVGDIDSARSISFRMTHSWDFTGFHELGAAIFRRKDFKVHHLGTLSEEILWIASDQDLGAFEKLEMKEPATTKRFHDSGYVVHRDSWSQTSNYMCFDCGELADGLSSDVIPSAAHGHLDALSILLCIHGEPFLVDGGFYTYFGDEGWHKIFRHEGTHNTLKISGFSQAEYCGRLKWQKAVIPKLIDFTESQNHLICSGAVEFSSHVKHQRTIHYRKQKFWIIQDTVKNDSGDFHCEAFLNFDSKVHLELIPDSNTLLAVRGEIKLLIVPVGDGQFEVFRGGAKPEQGWVCPGYGLKEKAFRAVFSWTEKKGLGSRMFFVVPLQRYAQSTHFFYDQDNNTFKVGSEKFKLDIDTLFTESISKGKSKIEQDG